MPGGGAFESGLSPQPWRLVPFKGILGPFEKAQLRKDVQHESCGLSWASPGPHH